MIMKKSVLFILLSICTLVRIYSNEMSDKTYYYYKGKKIEIPIDKTTITVRYSDSSDVEKLLNSNMAVKKSKQQLFDEYNKNSVKRITTYNIEKENFDKITNLLLKMPQVDYVGYHISPDSPIHITSEFGVKLNNLADTIYLQQLAEQTHTEIIQYEGWGNWFTLKTTAESVADALTCSNIFYESGRFKAVDPYFNFCFRTQSYTPTDSLYSQQWAIDGVDIDINVKDVWNLTKGNRNVKIAIVDDGINRFLSELSSVNFVSPYNTVSNTSVEVATTRDQETQFRTGHANAIASIIAANHNQGPMAGIVPNISLMNIFIDYGNLSSCKISRGIMWAVNNGADIINCSWGAHPDVNLSFYNSLKSEQLEEALDSALYQGRNGKGCVVVFAAGNEHRPTCSYPASYNPDLLVVGSVDITGKLDNKSNWGPELDIVAPGDNIMVYTNHGHDSAEGTSLATPHVAAVAGMILSLDRNLTREQVVRFIERSAQRILGPNLDEPYIYVYNSEGGFRSEELAHGLLDANNAINTDFSDQIIRGTCKIDGINIFVENLIPRNNPFIEMNASRNVVINKDFNMLKQSTLLINTTADLENYTIVWPLYF